MVGRFDNEVAILTRQANLYDPQHTIEPVRVTRDMASETAHWLERTAGKRGYVDPEALHYLIVLR